MKPRIITFMVVLMSASLSYAGPTEDLFDAINQGNHSKLKTSISAGADVNAFDKLGNTPLLMAIAYPDMVKDLLGAKADPSKFNKTNLTSPLMAACSYGQPEIVDLLLDAGANVNAADAILGFTPLFYAFNYGLTVDRIKTLVAKGANTKHINTAGNNLMEFFAAGGQSPEYRVEKMKDVANYYRSVGVKVHPIFEDKALQKWSTLEERLDLVLSYGFNVNQESPYIAPITTPNAAEINKMNAKFKLKIWPLFLAMTNYGSRAEMARLLIAKGADVNKEFGTGTFGLNRTILHVVALQGDKVSPGDKEALVKVLVEAGININKADGPGFTALMYAARNGNASFVRALLPHKPDLNITQKETKNENWSTYDNTVTVVKKTWRTALDWAAEMKQTATYNLIKDAGGKGASEVKK